MGSCQPDLKDQSGYLFLEMTNTKTHEEFSCSVDLNVSEITDKKKQESASKDGDSADDPLISNVDLDIKGKTSKDSSANSGFNGFGFSKNLLKTLEEKGYKEPSPIQRAAFPELMLGRDFVGQAQTGTGKTAAFALPLLERLETNQKSPQVLVLAPTRELALQVADSFKAYAAGHPHLKVLAVYGGADFRSQINSLKRGVDVVVGTPGRVMDHMRQGNLNTSGLRSLVLDEADEMLRMGFIDDVEWILEQLPDKRQMILFSATMPTEIRRLSKRYLAEPAEITIKSQEKEARLITQKFITIQNSYKLEALNRVLESFSGEGVIIFARTKAITISVAESLELSGHIVAVLNGDVPQSQRERTVERLREGNVNILVATDVAARGLDVDRIGLVINYDIPFDTEAYIHRIGRTGRAGRTGEAILFVNPRERRFINNLERAVGQSIDLMEIPSNATINQSRLDKLRVKLSKMAKSDCDDESEENALLKELIQRVAQELNITQEELSLAGLKLAIGDRPLLLQSDESWIKNASSHRRRREDKRQERLGGNRYQERTSRSYEDHLERYRVAVGYKDRVKPGNLVGAIANEAGIQGKMIGRIQIFESHSLVDLPKGMPDQVFKHLKKLKVMNRELQIQKAS